MSQTYLVLKTTIQIQVITNSSEEENEEDGQKFPHFKDKKINGLQENKWKPPWYRILKTLSGVARNYSIISLNMVAHLLIVPLVKVDTQENLSYGHKSSALDRDRY